MRCLIAALLLAAPIAAHDFWMRPERFAPPPDAPLAVRLFVGERGVGEAVARDDARLLRFELLDADGPRLVVGRDGADPAGLVRVRRAGPQWLVFANAPARLELQAPKFEAYLREQGLDAIRERRAARGESGAGARETYSRCAKSLVRAGAESGGASSVLVVTPVGLRLELVPLVDPGTLAPGLEGADFAVRLLLDGTPLPGALVKATLMADAPSPAAAAPSAAAPKAQPFSVPAATDISSRSDADGRATLHLPRGGPWLLCAEHMLVAEGEAAADHDYESLWASLSFEVPAR